MTPKRGFSAAAWASSPTALLLGVYLVAHVAMVLTGGRSEITTASTETLMKFGASYAPLVREGQLHRLVASMFLHIGLLHLLMNSAALLSIGPTLERDYGPTRFVAIYLASGVMGSVASVLWHLREPVVSAGASGAICGAIAAGAVRAHLDGPKRSDERRMLVSWAVATLAFGALIQADNAAHVGGLLAGGALGWLARKRARGSERPVAASALVVIVVMVAFGGSVLLREHSDTAPAKVNQGVDLARGGDLDGAIAAYRRALVLEPRDPTAHYDLGLALEQKDDFEAAIVHLERARELEPSPDHLRALVGAHINHGVSLANKGDLQGAIAAYRRALLLDEGSVPARRNLALALGEAGDRAGGIAELERTLAAQPSEDLQRALVSLLVRDAGELARAGKHREAIVQYRKAIGLEPNDSRTYVDLGDSLLEIDDADGAVAALEKAAKLEDSVEVRALLARAIEARRDARADAGDLSGALDDLGRATLLGLAPPPDAGVDSGARP